MHRALPVLTSQRFAGNVLLRGIAGRRLEQILSDPQRALFALVADQRVAVTGGGDSGRATALRWLDMAGLEALDLTYTGGEHLSLGGGDQQTPVYFLGEESVKERGTLRLAVDVAAAAPSWAEEYAVCLQVCAAASLVTRGAAINTSPMDTSPVYWQH